MQTKVFLILCATLPLLLASCIKEKAAAAPPGGRTADETVQGIGYVEPVSEVRRLVFKHPGVIGRCLVEVGHQARKGEVLMCLDDADERAVVNTAEATVALAKAELEQMLAGVHPARIRSQKAMLEAAKAEEAYARSELARQEALSASNGATSLAERDKARKEMESRAAMTRQAEAELAHLETYVRAEDRAVLEARVKEAEAKLAQARAALVETELRAPSDGIVLEVLLREGSPAYSAYPEPVLVFADLSKLRVRAEIDETYALRLKPGQPAVVRTRDEGHAESKGSISIVKAIMGKKTVFANTATERKDLDVRQVFIDLPDKTDLPVGLEVDVQIIAGR